MVLLKGTAVFGQNPSSPQSATSELEVTIQTQGPDPRAIVAGTPFQWDIRVRWYGDMSAVQPRIQKVPSWEGLQLVNQSTTVRTGTENGRRYSEKIFAYQLLPLEEGEVHIGTAHVRYILSEDETGSYLTTLPVTYPVQPAPFSWSRWFQGLWHTAAIRLLVYFLLIGIVIYVTLLQWRRYKKVETEPVTDTDPVKDAMESAKKFRLEGNHANFVRELRTAVQVSFQNRFTDVPSTDIQGYRDHIDIGLQMILDRFVEQCEHIQYAPMAPSPDELDRMYDDAQKLVGSSTLTNHSSN